MRNCWFIPFLAVVAQAQTITLTATHLTMEQGQPVPPLIWRASQTLGGLNCVGEPGLSTTATSSSAPGTYPITIGVGTFIARDEVGSRHPRIQPRTPFSCPGHPLAFVGNTLTVIPADGIGAKITPLVTYPPNFTNGPTNPVMDVTNNPTCNLVPNAPDTDVTTATNNVTCVNQLLRVHGRTSGTPPVLDCTIAPLYPHFLYFPTGVYTFNGQIRTCGNRWTFYGDGPQRSVMRLIPNTSFFGTGTNQFFFFPYSASVYNNFIEYLFNIGINTGYGNPNAVPLGLLTNNMGAQRNVVIWSDDSDCPEAFGLTISYPGPALTKNVAFYGCQSAIFTTMVQYSWTFDQITTEGQTGAAAIVAGMMKFSIEHWLSDNTVPAATLDIHGGMSILESSLLNGAPANTALTVNVGGSIYVRGISVTGYGTSLADSGTGTLVTRTGNITEAFTGPARSLFSGGTAGTLHLPSTETPLPTDDPNMANWTQLSTTVANWPAQIAGSASPTVYLPPGTYGGTGTTILNITVGDNVNHINFYNGGGTTAGYYFNIISNGTSSTPLVIDNCMYNECIINQTSSRSIALVDTSVCPVGNVQCPITHGYVASPGAGNLWWEDSLGSGISFVAGQSVWGRQFNSENLTTDLITCNGCRLWILGHKIETYPSAASVMNILNGQVEVFTQFIYPLNAPNPPSGSMIYLNDSSMWNPVMFDYVNIGGRNWQHFVTETQNGISRTWDSQPGAAGDFLLTYFSSGVNNFVTGSIGGTGSMQ